MKKCALFTLITIMAVSVFAATYTVDGYTFLEDQSDHSGIKVFFQRVAPDTNYSYTVYSSSTGYYSQVVENGWYDITYSKSSYISQDTTNVALYSNKTLNNITLQKQGLSGSISGVLTNGVYSVTGSLFIPEGDSLIIEPGVVLNFTTGTEFIVNGYLKAAGTETDSIYFNASTDTWNGLRLNYGSNGSIISHTKIEDTSSYAFYILNWGGDDFYDLNIDISNSYIDSGISIIGGNSDSLSVEFNKVKMVGGGIFLDGSFHLSIINCEIRECVYAIDEYNDIDMFKDCQINISNSLFASINNIKIMSSERLKICNSTFITSNDGFYRGSGTYIEIYNSAIFHYGGESCTGIGGSSDNTVVFNSNVYGFETNYNCGPYIGVNVTTNANGDPCDAYGNISMYPYFTDINNKNFRLLSSSPCIDAGTNNIAGYEFPQTDLDGNYRIWDGDGNSSEIVDMGAYEYGSQEIINSPTNVNISVSANILTITWDLMTGANSYLIYHSNNPYGNFELIATVGTNNWNSTIDVNTKKFYQIVASSDPAK